MASSSDFGAQVILQCDTCDSGNKIEWKCLTCGEIMCDTCKTFHLRTKALRDHKVVKSEEIDKFAGQEKLKNKIADVRCKEHKDELLHMFCKPCDRLVCRDCIAGTHNGHSFAKFEVIYDKKKSELQGYITQSEEKMVEYENVLRSCRSKKGKLSQERKESTDRLKERYTKLKSALEIAMERMKADLEHEESNDHEQLDDTIKEIEKEITSLRDFIKMCKVKISASPVEMLLFVPKAKATKKYEKLLKCPAFSAKVFMSSDASVEDVHSLLGFIDVGHKRVNIKLNVQVVLCIETNNPVNKLLVTDEKKLWIGKLKEKTVNLIDTEGKVIKAITIDTGLYDFTLNIHGDLLVTGYHGYKVKKLSKKSEKLVKLFDTSPFYTYGICTSRSCDILVGLCNYETKESKIIRTSPTGQILQSLDGLNKDKTHLFECPAILKEMGNGDICILQIPVQGNKSVVCVDWSGTSQFRYTGTDRLADGDEINADGLDIDEHNNIFILDYSTKTLHLLDEDGNFLQCLLQDDEIKPACIWLDKTGYLWVFDEENNKIYKIKYFDS